MIDEYYSPRFRYPSLAIALALVAAGAAGCTQAGAPVAVPSSPAAEVSQAPSPAPSPARVQTTVVAPEQIAGLAKSSDSTVIKLAQNTFGDLIKDKPGAVSGVYGTVQSRKLIMIAAFTGGNPDPDKTLDDWIATTKTGTYTAIAPGPLGGAARCRDAQSGSSTFAHCLWASSDVFGMIYFYMTDPASAQAQFAEVRAAVEVPKQ